MARTLILLPFLVLSLWAQMGEVGFAGGYGFYRNTTVDAPGGKATAGVRSRFAIGAVVTEDLYRYIGGELRWTYQDGDPFLSAGGVGSDIRGQSHAFNYDLLFYGRPAGSKIRPYVAAGGGVKLFRVTGAVPVAQPLASIAAVTGDSAVTVLGSVGAGVKYYVGRHLAIRLDLRDFISPFPKGVIKPAPGGTVRGLIHQITPMLGISYVIR